MNSDSQLDAALRGLDPAESKVEAQTNLAAQRALRQILAEPIPRRSKRTRLVASGAAAAAVAIALAVGPDLVTGQSPRAWSSNPENVTPEEARIAQEACAESIADSSSPLEWPAMQPVVTEERGSLIAVYWTDGAPRRSALTCFVEDGEVVAMHGGMATAAAAPERLPARDSIVVGLGGMTSDDRESIRETSGRVGADVVSVVFDTLAKGSVEATVRDGYVVAWWPDKPFAEMSESERRTPEIRGATVTLGDGTERYLALDEIWDVKLTK